LVPQAKNRQLHFDLKTNIIIMNTVHVLLFTTENHRTFEILYKIQDCIGPN
jgi:hypothetical protein